MNRIPHLKRIRARSAIRSREQDRIHHNHKQRPTEEIGIMADARSKNLLEMICQGITEGILLIGVSQDGDYYFTYANEALASIIGLRIDEIIATPLEAIFPESSHTFVTERFKEAIETGEPVIWLQDTKSLHTCEISVTPFVDDKIYLLCCLRDITEKKKAEARVLQLTRRMIVRVEEERSRIARDLHDDLNQKLALLAIELEQLGQDRFARSDKIRARVHRMLAQTQEVTQDIQHLSRQLHPSKLDHLGIVPAVKSYCEDLSRRVDFRIKFRHTNVPGSIPKEIGLNLFRIVQEALQNTIRHSGAAEAQVTLSGTEEEIHLTIKDSGTGFNVESKRTEGGLGLISMKERVLLVNGQISIHSSPLSGTCIKVSVPLTGKNSQHTC